MAKMSPEEKYQRTLEVKKRFYRKHRDELLTKFECPCGGSYDELLKPPFHNLLKMNFNKRPKNPIIERTLL